MSSSDYHKPPVAQSASRFSGLHFHKVEGLGNDFILIDERNVETSLTTQDRVQLCDRHFGVGADGVLTVQDSDEGLARMHVTNADGSVPEMCGNGLRCVAWWLCVQKQAPWGTPFVLSTDAGPKEVEVDRARALVRIDMGPARTKDVAITGEIRGGDLAHEGVQLTVSAVSMGNPHLVLFDALQTEVNSDDGRPPIWGPTLTEHAWFPDGVNVGFVRQTSDTSLDLVVYERGAGLTLACGTGACAAVAAHVDIHRMQPETPIAVHLPGGQLTISVSADLQRVVMQGPARVLFRGVLD